MRPNGQIESELFMSEPEKKFRSYGELMRAGVQAMRMDSKAPLEVSCRVHSDVPTEAVFIAAAKDLLKRLDQVPHIGVSPHPAILVLETQRDLLRHAIRFGIPIRLNEDNWRRTGFQLTGLFEEGKATLCVGENRFQFSDISKEDWEVVHGPLCGHGGFLYRDADGRVIFKTQTWIS
jgi:hypothetical protein